jgi:hypothetical protein
MIDEADAEQLATFAQPLRDVDVFGTWLWASTRMIVGGEDCFGIVNHWHLNVSLGCTIDAVSDPIETTWTPIGRCLALSNTTTNCF